MRLRAILAPAALISSLVSIAPTAWAEPGIFDRSAYLAQAKREGPEKEVSARTFLEKAADGPMDAKIDGAAAATIRAWIENRAVACTPPSTELELRCRMRGLVDGADVNYVTSPDGRRRWAALFVHTSPDDGNAGANELAVWKSTDGGTWAFQGVDIPWSYGHSRFADVGGRLTYVGWTGNWMQASDHKGPHATVTVSGTGPTFRIVRGPETDALLAPTRVNTTSAPHPPQGGSGEVPFWHNGSVVMVSDDEISYAEPSPTMGPLVGPGSILFKGHISRDRVEGVAYTFKRGCPPAPYPVRGSSYAGPGSVLILSGTPPVRAPGSCGVIGYRQGGASSVLRFDPMKEGNL